MITKVTPFTHDQLQLFKTTPGAISICESQAIAWLTEQVPPNGACMSVGSNAGKSSICEAIGLARQKRTRVLHCIDTVFDLNNAEAWKDNKTQEGPMTTGWNWIYELDFHSKFLDRIKQAGGGFVEAATHGESALTAIPRIGGANNGVAWAFCDADNNQRWLVDGIVDALAPLMVPGGIIAHHDWQSQFIAPHEAQERLLETGNFERVVIPWAEIEGVVDALGGDHPPDQITWHHKETPRPKFVGAIRRK